MSLPTTASCSSYSSFLIAAITSGPMPSMGDAICSGASLIGGKPVWLAGTDMCTNAMPGPSTTHSGCDRGHARPTSGLAAAAPHAWCAIPVPPLFLLACACACVCVHSGCR